MAPGAQRMGSLRCVPQGHVVLCPEGWTAEVFAGLPLEWPISPILGVYALGIPGTWGCENLHSRDRGMAQEPYRRQD